MGVHAKIWKDSSKNVVVVEGPPSMTCHFELFGPNLRLKMRKLLILDGPVKGTRRD